MKKIEKERAIALLEKATALIKKYDAQLVDYKTKYLGDSTGDYIIKGRNTCCGKPTNEFCFGYDGVYHQLHILDVCCFENGLKFAFAKISAESWGFWLILDKK